MCICASLHGRYLCVCVYMQTNGFTFKFKNCNIWFFVFLSQNIFTNLLFYFSERPQKIFGKFSDNSLLPNPFIIIPFLVSLQLSIFYLYVIHWLTLLLGVYTSLPKFLVTDLSSISLFPFLVPSCSLLSFHTISSLLNTVFFFFFLVSGDLPQFHWEVMRQMAYNFYSMYFSGKHSNFGPLSCAPNIRAHFFAIDTFQSLLLMSQ